MIFACIIFLLSTAFAQDFDYTPAQLQFKANVTNMSRVNFIWNSVDANNQTTYSIYCKNILSIYWKIVYIGLQTNCTVDNLEPFAKFYCEMEVCTRGVSKCEPRTDINVTFVNLAPERLRKPQNFITRRVNATAVELTWTDVITPYNGEYDLYCYMDGNNPSVSLRRRLNTTSFTLNTIRNPLAYRCELKVCWKSNFTGGWSEYCPLETKTTLAFKFPESAPTPGNSSITNTLVWSMLAIILSLFALK